MPPSLRHVILDLDGVVYNGRAPTRDAASAIARLRRSGRSVRFCTNNSSRTRSHYADKLSGMGIPTESGIESCDT